MKSTHRTAAFTLIELLVVIAIIALLLSIVMPALRMVKEKGRQVVCAANLKGVGLGVSAYLSENDDTFHTGANYGLWKNVDRIDSNYDENVELPYTSKRSYWGVAYAQYTSDYAVFECPSIRPGDVDFWWLPGEFFNGRSASELMEYFRYCGYGLNPNTNSSSDEPKKSTRFRLPAKVIFAQDHIEQRLEGPSQDMFCSPSPGALNLQQWRNYQNSNRDLYPNILGANFRHGRKSNGNEGVSNTLWLDGHVDPIKETDGEDVPISWYEGKTN